MDYGFTTAAYVVAAILFILSLGGLSGQESAKRAVWYGIAGMALAVVATLIGPGSGMWLLSLLLIAAGGTIGYFVAIRVQMTEMPQLVAAMHSLVGLAAVLVGFNAHIELNNVLAMGHDAREALTGFAALLAHKTPVEQSILRVEVFLGIFIGAGLACRHIDIGPDFTFVAHLDIGFAENTRTIASKVLVAPGVAWNELNGFGHDIGHVFGPFILRFVLDHDPIETKAGARARSGFGTARITDDVLF